jgi:hypothetical protein
MLIGLSVARQETDEEKKVHRLITRCRSYIFGSTEATPDYLAESLKWIEGIAPALLPTPGTSRSARILRFEANFHTVIARAIRWLQANRSLSSEQFNAKYPTLVADGLAQLRADRAYVHNCQANWSAAQLQREVPNLLGQYIHHDRLGDVIDEVLGLTGTPDAAEHTYFDSQQPCEIARWSPES